jgi:hypothetical protein
MFAQKDESKNVVPKHPKQKPALLPSPKSTEDESHGHLIIEVLPYVLKFVAMASEKNEYETDHSKCGQGMHLKRALSPLRPTIEE